MSFHILFEKEELRGQNFTKLAKSSPDKVFVICSYIKKVFNCRDSELHKTFTDNCYKSFFIYLAWPHGKSHGKLSR